MPSLCVATWMSSGADAGGVEGGQASSRGQYADARMPRWSMRRQVMRSQLGLEAGRGALATLVSKDQRKKQMRPGSSPGPLYTRHLSLTSPVFLTTSPTVRGCPGDGRTLVTRRGHWGLGTISSYFTTRARVNFGAKITNEGSPRSTEPPETDGDRDTAPKPCLTVATQSCDQAVTLATTGGSRHRPYFKVRTQ